MSIKLMFFCQFFILITTYFCYGKKLNLIGPHGHHSLLSDKNEILGVAIYPTVTVVLLIRNKGYALPWFFHYFENINYPKKSMELWIRIDHTSDNSQDLLDSWLSNMGNEYFDVNYKYETSPVAYDGETSTSQWSEKRFLFVMQLREEAIEHARKKRRDFIWYVDVDNILLDLEILQSLISAEVPVVAPMIRAMGDTTFANFWGAMSEEYYYERTHDYLKILTGQKTGLFPAAAIHSVFLIDLRDPAVKHLGFLPYSSYDGPLDDVIIFAKRCQYYDISLKVINRAKYGVMPQPMDSENNFSDEKNRFLLMITDLIIYSDLKDIPMRSTNIDLVDRDMYTLGFDQVYVISLERRSDRRKRIIALFDALDVAVELVDAVDGRLLNDEWLEANNIKQLPEYKDPFLDRHMKMGEIGCFMSHYMWWADMVKNNYSAAVVFEDDARPLTEFFESLEASLREIEHSNINWDLLYLGRKILEEDDEDMLEGSQYLVVPSYSYWTVSYALTREGALKLLAQKPLERMIPVDEYLPIMFNKHIVPDLLNGYYPRNLRALAITPQIVEPSYFLGDDGYFSDTEESKLISSSLLPNEESQNRMLHNLEGIMSNHEHGKTEL